MANPNKHTKLSLKHYVVCQHVCSIPNLMSIIYLVRIGLPHDTREARTVLRSGRRRQANSGMICMISRHLTAVLWLSPAPSARNSSNVPSSCHSWMGHSELKQIHIRSERKNCQWCDLGSLSAPLKAARHGGLRCSYSG